MDEVRTHFKFNGDYLSLNHQHDTSSQYIYIKFTIKISSIDLFFLLVKAGLITKLYSFNK